MPEVVIDTTVPGGWDAAFERVEQTGAQTGNSELEHFLPENVEYRADGYAYLVLSKNRENQWTSGKIRSRRNLTQLAPNGGRLEVLLQGVNVQNAGGGFCPGIWGALWAIPDASAVAWPMGGEIDFWECMQFPGRPETAKFGFSTLHFGPARGKDYLYPGHWGQKVGENYGWDAGDKLFVFEWHRAAGEEWCLSLALNGARLWSFTTTREDLFKDVEHRVGLNPEGFRPGQAGDPAAVFRRAFSTESLGYHIVCNLSYGGTPFHSVDPTLRVADLVVKHVRLEAY